MVTVLYARVSTEEQTIDHQSEHARKAGFAIDEVIADEGVSGVKMRLAQRPEGKRLFGKLRKGDVAGSIASAAITRTSATRSGTSCAAAS